MQSFLQHRQSRRAVEAEHARKKRCLEEKTRRTGQSNRDIAAQKSNVPAPRNAESSQSEDIEDRDVEKAESSKSSESGYGQIDRGETNDEHYHDESEQQLYPGCYATKSHHFYNSNKDGEVPAHPSVKHGPPPVNRTQGDRDAQTEDLEGQSAQRIPTQSSNTNQDAPLGYSLTGIDARERTTKEGKTGKGNEDIVFVVGYQGDKDPLNPHNWSYHTRIRTTFLIASIGFVVGVASSIDSVALRPAAAEFGVSQVTESLATGLYLVGFGSGALFAGPVSETLGRNPVYIFTLSMYMIFIMASALAPNIGAQLAFRFLAGFFGATPLVCAGGSISDLWTPTERVLAFPVFANSAFAGPIFGPVIGGWIVQSEYLNNWRWCDWITLIMSGLVLVLVILFQPETYPNVLLRWRAKHLRQITGDERYRAQAEVRLEPFHKRLMTALYRPFLLTFSEPIISLLALYLLIIYVVLFTFLDGYDYIFGQTYGLGEGLVGTCFLGIGVGLLLASALVPLIYRWAKRDLQKIQEAGGSRLPPEFRLWWAMLGPAFAVPISLFWMGWTAYPSISIWSPLAASVLFGYGLLGIFIASYQYVIDSYEVYSASALASMTLIRYVAAGGMTVVAIPMYENLGVHYSCTILGCIAAVMVPVPYAFYRYGPAIRKRSKYAVKID